jgi:hypothetical protein
MMRRYSFHLGRHVQHTTGFESQRLEASVHTGKLYENQIAASFAVCMADVELHEYGKANSLALKTLLSSGLYNPPLHERLVQQMK